MFLYIKLNAREKEYVSSEENQTRSGGCEDEDEEEIERGDGFIELVFC